MLDLCVHVKRPTLMRVSCPAGSFRDDPLGSRRRESRALASTVTVLALVMGVASLVKHVEFDANAACASTVLRLSYETCSTSARTTWFRSITVGLARGAA
jgi:hypothetical protein